MTTPDQINKCATKCKSIVLGHLLVLDALIKNEPVGISDAKKAMISLCGEKDGEIRNAIEVIYKVRNLII